MKIANATDVKNRFGEFLEDARDAPVVVSKTGRKVAVIVSWREFERLSALDDAWWGIQAQLAEREGYVGPEAAMEFIRKRMNEET